MTGVDVTLQCFIIARLADFCGYSGARTHEEQDPWSYMRHKLIELEDPIFRLKTQQVLAARDRFVKMLRGGYAPEKDVVEFKTLLEGYMRPGDFADVAFNLSPHILADPKARAWAIETLNNLRVESLFEEMARPEAERSSRTRRLVNDMRTRLDIDLLERLLTQRPRTGRRKRMVLRRLRRNVAEYCALLRLPTSPDDTFSPFLLPRVEALVVSTLALLNRFR